MFFIIPVIPISLFARTARTHQSDNASRQARTDAFSIIQLKAIVSHSTLLTQRQEAVRGCGGLRHPSDLLLTVLVLESYLQCFLSLTFSDRVVRATAVHLGVLTGRVDLVCSVLYCLLAFYCQTIPYAS